MNMRKFHFREQERDEEIFNIIHRHWFDIFVQFLPLVGMLIAILFILSLMTVLFSEGIPMAFVLFLFSFLALCIWLVGSVIWVDYYLDVWIITDRRVVNIEQKGFFLRHISELRYHKIQDVTTEVTGLIPTLLDYGDVHIQTAGTQPRFLFHNVGKPNSIKDKLISLQKSTRKKDLTQVRNIIHNTQEEQ